MRAKVDAAVRSRVSQLAKRIAQETGLDAGDYRAVAAAKSPLDALRRTCMEPQSQLTTTLVEKGRLDLTIESAVLEWEKDLPLTADLVDYTRSRCEWLAR